MAQARGIVSRTQDTVGRNGAYTPLTIGPLGLDGELPLLAWAHVQKTLVPTLDDLALSNGEAERLAAVVGGVELAAVLLEGTSVVHVDLVAGLSLAVALDSG